MAEPCNWTIDTGCCSGWAGFTPAVQASATSWASYILWALTGRQFGLCPVTVRPCFRRCEPRTYMTYGVWMESPWGGSSGGSWIPWISGDGEWRNCGNCCGVCCCGASCEVWLPGPVAQIQSVLVNNVVVDPAAYRVDNEDVLVRQDGGCWPECANLDVPPSSTNNTFVVTYSRGSALPAGAAIAAGMLACEFAKACTGQPCALPDTVRSISRQGMQFELVDPNTEFDHGRTGIIQVDRFISAVNPHHLASRPEVYSIDMMYPRQQTWP